jgi:transposase
LKHYPRIILLLADGVTITAIAATVGVSRQFVYKWAQRFMQAGLAGLEEQPGRGGHRRPQPLPHYRRDMYVG